MSPSLSLFPEPMVNIWPSNSLQAPTSDAFLGMIALAPLPRPPWPRPALPLFPPCPPQPALAVQAIFLVSKAPRMVGRWLLQKTPRIHYPGSCWAVSRWNYPNPCFRMLCKVTQTLHSCPSCRQDRPSSPTDLYAWCSLPVFPNELVRAIIFASVLEEFDRAVPDARNRPCQTLV
jgi:hypothetical protein